MIANLSVMLSIFSATAAFTLPTSLRAPSARLAISMFEEAPKEQFELRPSRDTSERKGCSVVLTEGTGSYYASRALIQMLHDFGSHSSITVQGESVADMKKALISRASRYSGLLDVLDYSEAESWAQADAWLAINADEAALPAQIEAARAAGVKRAFVMITEDGPSPTLSDADSIEALLKSSGLAYTVMRTGALIEEDPEGGGLVLGEVDMPVCGAVSKADVFRFVTEALTLSEAEGRTFSLCPSESTQASLREMRLCGYERREEVAALLKGVIEETPATADLSPEEAEVHSCTCSCNPTTSTHDATPAGPRPVLSPLPCAGGGTVRSAVGSRDRRRARRGVARRNRTCQGTRRGGRSSPQVRGAREGGEARGDGQVLSDWRAPRRGRHPRLPAAPARVKHDRAGLLYILPPQSNCSSGGVVNVVCVSRRRAVPESRLVCSADCGLASCGLRAASVPVSVSYSYFFLEANQILNIARWPRGPLNR